MVRGSLSLSLYWYCRVAGGRARHDPGGPATSPDAELIAQITDGRLLITLEAASDKQFLDYLLVDGRVYLPGGRSVPVHLSQTAPGRYETEIECPRGSRATTSSPSTRAGAAGSSPPIIGGASQHRPARSTAATAPT